MAELCLFPVIERMRGRERECLETKKEKIFYLSDLVQDDVTL